MSGDDGPDPMILALWFAGPRFCLVRMPSNPTVLPKFWGILSLDRCVSFPDWRARLFLPSNGPGLVLPDVG